MGCHFTARAAITLEKNPPGNRWRDSASDSNRRRGEVWREGAPQQHGTGLAGGRFLKAVHLEVVPVRRGVLWTQV